MTASAALLSAHNLRKKYKSRTVVTDVSFEVAAGEVVGLLGPNGAGKTTCFYMIVGLVAADGGEIRIESGTVFFQAENTVGKAYETAPGYMMPRRLQYYGLRWNFWN